MKVWCVDTGKLLYELAERAEAFAMSPDGALVAAGGSPTTIWNAASGSRLQSLETGPTAALGFGPDGKTLVTLSAKPKFDGLTVAVWDAPTGARKRAFSIALARETVARVAGPNHLAAVAWDDRTVRIWDAEKQQEVQKLAGHADRVTALAFSPDGRMLATAGADQTVRMWEAAGGKERKLLFGGYERSPRAAFSRDGTLLAVSADAGIELWDLKRGQKGIRQTKGG